MLMEVDSLLVLLLMEVDSLLKAEELVLLLLLIEVEDVVLLVLLIEVEGNLVVLLLIEVDSVVLLNVEELVLLVLALGGTVEVEVEELLVDLDELELGSSAVDVEALVEVEVEVGAASLLFQNASTGSVSSWGKLAEVTTASSLTSTMTEVELVAAEVSASLSFQKASNSGTFLLIFLKFSRSHRSLGKFKSDTF